MQIKDVRNRFSTRRKFTDEGFLVVGAAVARVGVQDYSSESFDYNELPNNLKGSNRPIKLFRPEQEVFAKDTLNSIANKPVTDDHPASFVDASNVRHLQVGFSKDSVKTEGDFVRADLVIQDKETIERIMDGKKEISLGYHTDIKWKAGDDPRYGQYDGIQTNIKTNHIAIVQSGRAGHNVKLDDSKKETAMVKRMLDGLTVEFNDQAAEAYDKKADEVEGLQKQLADEKDDCNKKKALVDELEGKLAAKDAEIEALKDPKHLQDSINARVSLVERAKSLCDIDDVEALSDLELKKATIAKCLGDKIDLENKADDFVNGVFAVLEPKSESKKLGDELTKMEDTEDKNDVDAARQRMIASRRVK